MLLQHTYADTVLKQK